MPSLGMWEGMNHHILPGVRVAARAQAMVGLSQCCAPLVHLGSFDAGGWGWGICSVTTRELAALGADGCLANSSTCLAGIAVGVEDIRLGRGAFERHAIHTLFNLDSVAPIKR